MVSSKQALAEAHAAAARRAARARVAALKAGTSAKPVVDATWAKLMQGCADCQQRAEAAETLETWRAFAAAAHALRDAVGIEGDKCEEPGCKTCQPTPFLFVPKGVVMPPAPPKDEPTPEERRNAQAFAKKATCDAGIGLGGLLLKRGRRGEACDALATALKADESNGEAWTLRAAAFAEMGEDGSILEIVELHLRKAAQLSPDDDELQAQHAVAACRAAVVMEATDPPRVEGTLAERARQASTLLEDGATLMREGLYKTAHSRYLRAVDLLDALPGPKAKAAADEARLNAAGCLLQLPGDHDVASLCDALPSTRALLRRAAARERRGDYAAALADLREARLSSVDRALVDARIAHCEHLRDTRGVVV
ncbi:unnamed protein product [Pelagomonas calceolata]|uniref:Uncharacterized protein n=1 Tax=Pelagomonas calceolata TaxID=35677 RepID=A0A8J2SUY4_9STRA|nr:unnamed protein product [Pelagomonas calceolata]